MKKLLAILLATVMVLSLCACGSSSKPKKPIEEISDEDWEAIAEAMEEMNDEESAEEAEPTEKVYQLGESFTTEDGTLEITIDSFGFSDKRSNSGMLPPVDGEYYTEAAEGKTFFYYTGTVTLVEDVKEQTLFYNSFHLYYNDDYKFMGSSDATFQGNEKNNVIEPLMGTKTVELRGFIEVPKSVETDEEGSLQMAYMFSTGHYGSSKSTRSEFTVQLR